MNSGNQPEAGNASRFRRLMSVAAAAVAVAYVAWMTLGHLDQLRTSLSGIAPAGMIGFLALATASIATTTIYHAALLRELATNRPPCLKVCAAYAVGQIVRYLPGKVWGLLYEANALRGHAELGAITLSILMQTAFGYAWATALASAVLLADYFNTSTTYLLLVPAAFALWLAHKTLWARRLIVALPMLGKYLGSRQLSGLNANASLMLSALLILNWLPFLGGWVLLLAESHTPGTAISYGAAYMLASIVTTALVVVPSGIVVREALFTWIGTVIGLPVADLLLYGFVVRLILTSADLVNAGIFVATEWRARNVAHGR